MENFIPGKAWEESKKQVNENSSTSNKSLPVQELFGNRFYSDQTSVELMSEFLLIVSSPRKVIAGLDDKRKEEFSTYFPGKEMLPSLRKGALYYEQQARLNLKLFAILMNSGNPNPYPAHKNQYDLIIEQLKGSIEILDNQKVSGVEDVIAILSNLYMGFQGIGANRDWCAQSFLPVTKNLLAGETIWKATKAKKAKLTTYDPDQIKSFFERTGRNFYAHGGELLYLQLALGLTKSKDEIENWLLEDKELASLGISEDEKDPELIRNKLTMGFEALLEKGSPKLLGEISEFIDGMGDQIKFSELTKSGWIPEDSWHDGYLFALDLVRIFDTEFDIVDNLAMVELACDMQVFRTMLGRSSRQLQKDYPLLAVVSSSCTDINLKQISKNSLKNCQTLIHTAIEENANKMNMNDPIQLKNMHRKYGDKVFLKLAKSIQFVIPIKGSTEHFVLTKNMMTFLVVTALSPSKRMSLDTFLSEVRIKHKLVFDDVGFNHVNLSCNKMQKISNGTTARWLIHMLEECGYLIPLSDSLSLVINTAGNGKESNE
jgi:hypothetical protein